MGIFFPKVVSRDHVHRFYAATLDGVPLMGRWKCKCGMKVRDRATAKRLDGKRI